MKQKAFSIFLFIVLALTLVTGCSSETAIMETGISSDESMDSSTKGVTPGGGGFVSIAAQAGVTPDESMGAPPEGEPPEGAPPGGGGSASVDTGTGAYIISDGEEISGGTYTSSNDDENAIRAEGGVNATLDNVTVEKTGGSASSNDASSFYGLNAAILALDDATLTINGGSVTATPEGSNGVFAYDGATIDITDTEINVSGGNAGGIEVAGGGTMHANNLTVNAMVKAAIRSDRGGGTMVIDGGTYTTSGSSGAPAIYSTADITANKATLISNNSEAVVIEGLNSVTINDSNVTGNMSGTYGDESGENIHNVMLYQSMSGDAGAGTSVFTMNGGFLVSKSGDMFYITNTSSIINLSGVDLTPAAETYLIRVAGNDGSRGWGTAGSNGGICEVNLTGQTISGDIMVDPISQLAMTIADSSSYTGAINSDGTTASSLTATIDDSSTWTLTGDSYITELNGSMDNVVLNGHTLYVNGTAMAGSSGTEDVTSDTENAAEEDDSHGYTILALIVAIVAAVSIGAAVLIRIRKSRNQ